MIKQTGIPLFINAKVELVVVWLLDCRRFGLNKWVLVSVRLVYRKQEWSWNYSRVGCCKNSWHSGEKESGEGEVFLCHIQNSSLICDCEQRHSASLESTHIFFLCLPVFPMYPATCLCIVNRMTLFQLAISTPALVTKLLNLKTCAWQPVSLKI